MFILSVLEAIGSLVTMIQRFRSLDGGIEMFMHNILSMETRLETEKVDALLHLDRKTECTSELSRICLCSAPNE